MPPLLVMNKRMMYWRRHNGRSGSEPIQFSRLEFYFKSIEGTASMRMGKYMMPLSIHLW